jgi:hypothetical protein
MAIVIESCVPPGQWRDGALKDATIISNYSHLIILTFISKLHYIYGSDISDSQWLRLNESTVLIKGNMVVGITASH